MNSDNKPMPTDLKDESQSSTADRERTLSPVRPEPQSHVLSGSHMPNTIPAPGVVPSVEHSRKRGRDDTASSSSGRSRASSFQSGTVVTPRLEAAEPPIKRRAVNTERNQLDDRDEEEVRQSPDFSLLRDKLADFPIPPQEPLTVFPLSFGWPPAGPSGANGNGSPNAASGNDRNIAIDPALSSVRSSAAMPGVGDPPELHFPDETLNSAAVSTGGDHDAAMLEGDSSMDNDLLDPGDKKDQPFSRSPELRVSHKLAERKRRKEMKDLFDELRDLLPAERGSKSSKWEILSKSIDFIAHLKNVNGEMVREMEKIRRELDAARGSSGSYPTYQSYTVPPTYPPPGPYPPAGTGVETKLASSPPPAPQTEPRSG